MKLLYAVLLLAGSVSGQNDTLTLGGRILVSCRPSSSVKNWSAVSDCYLEQGVEITDVMRAPDGEIERLQNEQREMVKYSDVCAKWGRWHYRKGKPFKSDGHGGGTTTYPDRYRVCLVQKRVYQEIIQ